MKHDNKTIYIKNSDSVAGIGLTRCLKDYYNVVGSGLTKLSECPNSLISDYTVDIVDSLPVDWDTSVELLFHESKFIASFSKSKVGDNSTVCSYEPNYLDAALEEARKQTEITGKDAHGVYAFRYLKGLLVYAGNTYLTDSLPYYHQAGYNLPMAMVRLHFNDQFRLKKYPLGTGCLRRVDSLPFVGYLP